ncbi:hypothetical protein F0562_023655 [Nyssa sinensis]|uniref:C2H2-type domain-containing protein n=1 Tax=Nyssa sinensis TaxID=561372 RepID=A0A5J5BH31_9ASTE|nr:hypothetical protein F0562_023655 [Nyssa sinensis]
MVKVAGKIIEREMAEGRRENVMSVELAIQRELAYQKKVASLRSHSIDYFAEDLLPLQVSSSSPSLLPGPNLNSSSSTSLVPRSTCQVTSTTPSPKPLPVPTQIPSPRPRLGPSLDPHPSYQLSSSNRSPIPRPLPAPSRIPSPRPSLSGIKRIATTSNHQCLPPQQRTPSQNNYIIIDQVGNFFCKICRVPCSGASNLKQHLKGHKHKATLQWLQLNRKNGEKNEDQRPQCELCQIWCTNDDSFNMHLKGQKHQAKLQVLELSKENGGEKVNQRPRCELCQIWCMNEDAFKQHLKGKTHVTRLYAIEEKNRARGGEAEMMNLDIEELEWKMVS